MARVREYRLKPRKLKNLSTKLMAARSRASVATSPQRQHQAGDHLREGDEVGVGSRRRHRPGERDELEDAGRGSKSSLFVG